MIFTKFGWEWVAGDVAKLSRNVNDRKKEVKGGDSDKKAKDDAKAAEKKSKKDSIARFLPRIAELNAQDVILYREARERYEAKKKRMAAEE